MGSVWTRKLAGIVRQQISRLFGIRRVHRVVADAALSMESALGAKVKRGHNPASPEADIQKVEYLLRQDERLLGLINDLENQSRQQIEELRGAIEGTAREL